MIEELKELLKKHDAVIYIEISGEGYSQKYNLAIESKNKNIASFGNELTYYDL